MGKEENRRTERQIAQYLKSPMSLYKANVNGAISISRNVRELRQNKCIIHRQMYRGLFGTRLKIVRKSYDNHFARNIFRSIRR